MIREPDDAREALDMIREIGGEELVVRLLASFVAYADLQLASAAAAAPQGNAVEVSRVAHALKSSARQLGAHALADACEGAEERGRGPDAGKTVVEDVRAMQAAYEPVRRWMAGMTGRA